MKKIIFLLFCIQFSWCSQTNLFHFLNAMLHDDKSVDTLDDQLMINDKLLFDLLPEQYHEALKNELQEKITKTSDTYNPYFYIQSNYLKKEYQWENLLECYKNSSIKIFIHPINHMI